MKKKKPNMFQKYLRRAVAALCIICVVLGTPVHAFAESGGSSPDELIDEESAENTSESTDTAESREELISEDSSAEDTSATDFSTENSSAGVTVSSTDELIEESNENITQADSLSDGETLVDESAEENSSENTSAQIRRSTMRIRRAMTAQNTAAPSFTITHEAGADSKFSNGSSENKVTYTLTHHDTSITKYSHTSNIDDTGGNDGSYATDFSTTDIITIPGATKLTIDVWYSTDSSDWLAIYPAGITPSDSNYASASISGGKLSGGGAYSKSDATHKQFTVNGDTAQFYFKSNSSWFKQGTYGYYATITADGYDSYDATSGTYEDPIPDNSQNSFLGWYTDASYSSKIEDPISLKTNSTVYAKIARYTDTGTWGTCPWGITKDGILEIGAGTGGEQTWVYGSITSPWKAYSDKIIAIKAIGAVKAPSNCAYLFDGLSKVTSADLKDFDTGKVTDMFRMFYECKSLTSLDANGWNTSKVTDMSWMFHGCESLTSLDVSGWNTSKVTDMIRMFYGCNALTSLDVSGWNTGNMTTMNYMFSGCSALTDIDLKKFFANVPQDRLMSLVHDIINDGDTESLIRKYLKAGVMTPQGYEETKLGTPQGGNLSPLLSNIMLNELDKELEARGLRFTRYADDCVIAVRSEASAKRVMRTVTDWIQRKLGLKVNTTKTHITRPTKLKYLGFGFYMGSKANEWKCRPHQDSVKKFKSRLKELTCRKMPGTVTSKVAKINQVTRGWINYYALGSMKATMTEIDAHLRTRLRVIIWKQWKVPKKREWGLLKLGINPYWAKRTSQWGDHYQFVATKSCLSRAVSKAVLAKAGLVSCLDYYNERHALKLC